MNAHVISQPQSNWSFERIITHVLNWVLMGVAYTIVMSTLLGMVHTDHINDRISNPLYEGLSYITGPLVIVMAIMLTFQIFLIKDAVTDSASFFPKIFKSRVWTYSVASVATAIVAGAISLVFEYENSTLGTPYGHVRLMEDGSVLTSGRTVEYDPAYVGSVPVSLNHEMNTSYVVKNDTGYSKYMTVVVNISLDGDALLFKKILSWQDKKNLGWGEKNHRQASAQKVVFMKMITPLLEPVVAQVFKEIDLGTLQGGNDIIMLRLGDVFNEMVKNGAIRVPSWILTTNVTEVEVTGWQQS